MTETTQRILDLMQAKGLKAYQLEVGANLPNASIQSWIKGKKRKDGSISATSPSADAIIKLARYFNVSADYLLCLTDEPKPLQQSDDEKHAVALLSNELAELSQDQQFTDSVKLYKAMTDEYKRQICTYILGVAAGLGLNIQQILNK